MSITPIKKLTIKCETKYHMTVNKVYSSSMSICIDGKSFYIAIPKNDSWNNISIYNGLECIVTKEKYYNNEKEYAMLKLIEITSTRNYKEKKTNTTYSRNYHKEDNSMSEWIKQAKLTKGWD